jgi:Phasin protein
LVAASTTAREWNVIMPTTPEKPGKPRPRNRKASGQKKAKAGAEAQILRDQAQTDGVTLDAEPVSRARLEDIPADVTPVETAPVELAAAEVVLDIAPVDVAPETAFAAVAMEKVQEEQEEREGQSQQSMARQQMVQEAPLSGEVLPPEVRVAPQAGVFAIAQAYGEYTRKSWLNGRFLVERLIAVRSFDEAIEIQGEFAKQAYTNFVVQSQKIGMLYGEWAQQFFRPFEKIAAGWPRIGR